MTLSRFPSPPSLRRLIQYGLCFFLAAVCANAQTSPWGTAATKLATEFTGPIAKGLALVAIVVGGITVAFSENGGSRRIIGGLVFGLGMALSAASFLTWLFG
jgi:type IV secretory pathway VirB2 component (pilin)